MTRLREFIRSQPVSLKALATAIALTLVIGLFTATVSLVNTINSKQLTSHPLCITSECIAFFVKETSGSLGIVKATIDLVVAIATTGGIFVALLSYLNTAGNAALANHIEHLKVFSEYVEAEIRKRDRLAPHLIDTLHLYGTIFSQSRSGKTTVSDEYRKIIVTLNNIINESNQRSVIGTPGGFSYNDHQRRVRDHLAQAGIVVYTAPRNDYFEMEGQLFSLLHRISQSFCAPGAVPPIVQRTYY